MMNTVDIAAMRGAERHPKVIQEFAEYKAAVAALDRG